MKLRRAFLFTLAGIIFLAAGIFADDLKPANAPVIERPCTNCLHRSPESDPTNTVATTPAVYVPDLTHAAGPLPDGVLAWDNIMHQTDAAADQAEAHFTFLFTNVWRDNVTILDVHPSCGCTTAQLPELPWTIASGTNGQIGITVDLRGKNGMLFKTVKISTDKGTKDLMVRVNILQPVTPTLTDEDRAQGMAAAKVDRQAVFKGDCATCHAKPAEAKYGPQLYAAVCGICHEAEHRATMVPDLHAIKTPTNDQFWQTWIAHGKPGSLMPAFSTAEGGPLTDVQIASLAAYLDSAIPSHIAPPAQ